MGQILDPEPALFLLAAFSKYPTALDWARQRAESAWGPIALASPRFDFRETDYYASTMGAGLSKCFFAFSKLSDPNSWESDYAKTGGQAESRPLNLDPGYLTLAKLVLASTKDHAHRIYLDRGIYAEVTLYYKDRRWQHRDWTFPDYRRSDYQQFFDVCRQHLRDCL